MLKLNNLSLISIDGVQTKSIWVENGVIKEIKDSPYKDGITFDTHAYLMPGFIDLFVSGYDDALFSDANIQVNEFIVESIHKTGVTSLLAQLEAADHLEKSLAAINYYQKRKSELATTVLGVHLEGPYLNDMLEPSILNFRGFEDQANAFIRMLSLDLAYLKSVDLIKYLKAKHIIPALYKHSKTYGYFVEGITNGLSVSSYHVLSKSLSLSPLGSLGNVLLHDDVFQTINDDLTYLSKEALELIYKNKGPFGLILTGQHEAGYKSLLSTIKHMIEWLNISLVEITWMASYNPAKLLGVSKSKGTIEVGKDADLVVLDENYDVLLTIIEGRITWNKKQ